MHSVKNTPRTPEEQQKALAAFLAAQENEDLTKKKKRSSVTSLFTNKKLKSDDNISLSPLTSQKKDNKGISLPSIPMKPSLPVKPSLPIKPTLPIKPALSPKPVRNENIIVQKSVKNRPLSIEEQQKAAEEYLASIQQEELDKKNKQNENIIVQKSKKNKPLSIEEQQKAAEAYLASIQQEELDKKNKQNENIIVQKSKKNKPLSIEEQQKAAEEYLASVEKQQTEEYLISAQKQEFLNKIKQENEKRKTTPTNNIVSSPPIEKSKDIKISRTSKNQPLTPEEQQIAFEEYLASLEKKEEEKIKITKTNKNQPLSLEEQQNAFAEYFTSQVPLLPKKPTVHKQRPTSMQVLKNEPRTLEEQQKALDEFLATVETHSVTKVNKNRPLTPQEQQIALDEFMARKKREKRELEQQKSAKLTKAFKLKGTKNSSFPAPPKENNDFSPLPKASELTKFLLYNHDFVGAILDCSKNINQKEVVGAILHIFITNRIEAKLILGRLKLDLDNSLDEATLFRDNTAGTQLFSSYLKLKGVNYLEKVLAVILERLVYRIDALEVDPKRCPDDTALKNVSILHKYVNDLLDRIFASQKYFPKCLSFIFHKLQEMVKEKYPDSIAKMTGGFYFLRFLSPMALDPVNNKLCDCKISASCRRSLLLCMKIIQCVSNNVKFNAKEKFMIPFNEIIIGRREDTVNFLENLGNFRDLSNEEPELTENEIKNKTNQSLRILAKSIAENFKDISELLDETHHDKLLQLRIIIEQIENIEPIGWVPLEDIVEEKPKIVSEEDSDLEINRDAFILLREAFQQCEAELREIKIRFEEERQVRKSLQTIVVELADNIHERIDERVAFKLEQVSKLAKEKGVDMEFCNEINDLAATIQNGEEEIEEEIDDNIIDNTPITGKRPNFDFIELNSKAIRSTPTTTPLPSRTIELEVTEDIPRLDKVILKHNNTLSNKEGEIEPIKQENNTKRRRPPPQPDIDPKYIEQIINQQENIIKDNNTDSIEEQVITVREKPTQQIKAKSMGETKIHKDPIKQELPESVEQNPIKRELPRSISVQGKRKGNLPIIKQNDVELDKTPKTKIQPIRRPSSAIRSSPNRELPTPQSNTDTNKEAKRALPTPQSNSDANKVVKRELPTPQSTSDTNKEAKRSLTTPQSNSDANTVAKRTPQSNSDTNKEAKRALPTPQSNSDTNKEANRSLPTPQSNSDANTVAKRALPTPQTTPDTNKEAKRPLPKPQSNSDTNKEAKRALPTPQPTSNSNQQTKRSLPKPPT